MTTKEMREKAEIFQKAGIESRCEDIANRFHVISNIWLAAAEICQRLDRLLPEENEK